MSQEPIRYNLESLETLYLEATAKGKPESGTRLRRMLDTLRYELRLNRPLFLEYQNVQAEPLLMRQIFSEADFDRWISQRFPRLEEF